MAEAPDACDTVLTGGGRMKLDEAVDEIECEVGGGGVAGAGLYAGDWGWNKFVLIIFPDSKWLARRKSSQLLVTEFSTSADAGFEKRREIQNVEFFNDFFSQLPNIRH